MNNASTYQSGDLIGGVYEVHQCLTGGMGNVYLCLDRAQHEPYALKTLHSRACMNQDLRKTFEREITTWIALENHPNIVRCFSMNVFDGRPFMILEWVSCDEQRGSDLRSWVESGPLDLRTALEVVIDIARGLAHAQEKQPGIVHCDIKPDNILIDDGRVAKITDFGLARIFQSTSLCVPQDKHAPGRLQTVREDRHIVGTPAYMAPEQWRGGRLDVRTDLYALGCVLYEMVTGHWVFDGSTLTGFRRNHLEAEIPHLSGEHNVPPMLDAVFDRCLAKKPDDRFASVEELLYHVTDLYFQEFSALPRVTGSRNGFTAIDFNNRGSTYARLQFYTEALRDFDAAIAHDSNYAIAYVNRGSVSAALDRYEDALYDYTHALAIDPTDSLIYLLRGQAYVGINEHHAALIDYTQAIKLEPTDAAFYYWRAKTYLMLCKPDRALADFSIATMLNPEYTAAYYDTGIMLKQQGKLHAGLAYFKKAAEFGSVDALRQIARVAEQLQTPETLDVPVPNRALALA